MTKKIKTDGYHKVKHLYNFTRKDRRPSGVYFSKGGSARGSVARYKGWTIFRTTERGKLEYFWIGGARTIFYATIAACKKAIDNRLRHNPGKKKL